jgi:hypothetical protein
MDVQIVVFPETKIATIEHFGSGVAIDAENGVDIVNGTRAIKALYKIDLAENLGFETSDIHQLTRGAIFKTCTELRWWD